MRDFALYKILNLLRKEFYGCANFAHYFDTSLGVSYCIFKKRYHIDLATLLITVIFKSNSKMDYLSIINSNFIHF